MARNLARSSSGLVSSSASSSTLRWKASRLSSRFTYSLGLWRSGADSAAAAFVPAEGDALVDMLTLQITPAAGGVHRDARPAARDAASSLR